MIKIVQYARYAHKSNLNQLISNLNYSEAERVKKIVRTFNNPFDIIKYNNGVVSLMRSSDWDTANEPTIDVSYTIGLDNSVKVIRNGRQVYHNKWQFVSDDYTGFDIEEAKQRTKLWNSIPNINSYKNRIGNKVFWHELLNEYDIEI